MRAIDSSEQELILAHEEEHVRAGDARLRFLMTLPLFVFPWNPALWLQRHRLNLAVELDCDRRVMRRMPGHRHAYGNLLLRVGAGRNGLHRLALVSLSEGRSQLERRIRRLVEKMPRARRIQVSLLLLGAAAIVTLAILFPRIRGEDASVPEELAELMAEPTFTPYTVRPDLVNEREVQRALEREYPRTLRDAGIGGTTTVNFFIDTEGEVQRSLVASSSDHEVLDSAALRVARVFRFTPALNLDEVVPVWIAIPISFGTTNDADSTRAEAAREFFEAMRRFRDADTTASAADSSAILEAIERFSSPTEASVADTPTFTPYTVRPDLVNEAEIMQAMEDEYPPILRDAGVGGTTNVHFFINVEGVVQRALVAQSSGHEALDSAALRVARIFRFTPALDEDEPVPVWIAIPLTFQPQDEVASGQQEAPAVPPFADRVYPPIFRDAVIGNTVQVRWFIDADGKVQRTISRKRPGGGYQGVIVRSLFDPLPPRSPGGADETAN